MEAATNTEIRAALTMLTSVQNHNMPFAEVNGKQIIGALNHNLGLRSSRGYLYQVQQEVANEARSRGLIRNPDPFNQAQSYSTAVGNTARMMPSAHGWEQTKGIQVRHMINAAADLRQLLFRREQNLSGPRTNLPVPGR